MDQTKIRNFCIIAHIDHGKSTLADRLLELTGTVEHRLMRNQMLDKMDLEREKGITIKLAPVTMRYQGYELNLIDTPGHVDFSYEVSRSLAACEGALLLVDASQGIQAQTLANVYLALAANLTIIPVINKIDLPAADIATVTSEIVSLLGCQPSAVLAVSAKNGQGVEAVLEKVITNIPSPRGNTNPPTRALVFDSYYDDFRGVILYLRVVDGSIHQHDHIRLLSAASNTQVLEIGRLVPQLLPTDGLNSGDIGYIVTNFKSAREAKVGDTLTLEEDKDVEILPGYKDIKPFVYAGFFPDSHEQYQTLKDSIERLSLSDSALQYTSESSPMLGHGFRIGFLGLLHLEIIRERLEREYDLTLIVTNPSTDYRVRLSSDEEIIIQSAAALPDQSKITAIKEPWIKGEIVCPKDYVGSIMKLVASKRGQHENLSYVDDKLSIITFTAPLANMLTDFYDQLKSITSGYGSFNYELDGYRQENLVRLDFYVAGDRLDILSMIVHRSEAQTIGRQIIEKLKMVIPKQQFQVSLQAAINSKFIARDDISAYRKDVTGSLYGGDISRRKKLLTKQKRGKQRMKRFGKVDIPAEAFAVMLKR
ncbi:MAG: translation elongation factor 4 [Candidatus Saccharimonadales bacterium]|jgi:GTP-binding protein LepA